MGKRKPINADAVYGKVKRAINNPAMAANVLRKKASVAVSHKFLDGYSIAPDELTLYLTYRCHLLCKVFVI